jgi:major membrane immunogen (membrane-anchored lipoprotein)
MIATLLLLISCSDNEKDPITKNTNTETAQSESTYNSSTDAEATNKDGTYSATVEYNNPETGYTATYTLDVEVEDGQVTQIIFPKGGWLDDDHITPADIDEDGHAEVYSEDGKTYDVQIDER